jgi:hypothetical protein
MGVRSFAVVRAVGILAAIRSPPIDTFNDEVISLSIDDSA